MNNDPKQNQEPEADDKDENIPGHIVRTGLPPGISPNEARDPGAATPRPEKEKPVDNRT